MEKAVSYFEGAEKKVELVTASSVPSLRGLGADLWTEVVSRAGASVLSRISGDGCDAYLLSESSLFVFDHKMLMITCGRTRLADAVLRLLEVVPPEQIEFFIYQRKNEVFPHNQPTSFFDDVEVLNRRLPGRAFKFGDEDEHHLYLYHLVRPWEGAEQDATLELLMYGIGAAEPFSAAGGSDTSRVREQTGVHRILPGFLVDDHLFEPGGYSLNAIRGEQYWTLHVTPEANASYASFETNRPWGDDLDGLVERVLEVFRPRSFDVVLFERSGDSRCAGSSYRLKAHVAERLDCGYQVRFLSFYRPQDGIRQPVELPVG